MRSFLGVKAAVMVYNSMLLPIIDYGDVFLSAASKANRKKLQTLQNKGLRCAPIKVSMLVVMSCIVRLAY